MARSRSASCIPGGHHSCRHDRVAADRRRIVRCGRILNRTRRNRMSRTESTMLELGTPAPAFALPEVDGGTVGLDDFESAPALLVMFICNHCPFVKHVRG